jgi:hypothetical protein
VIKDNKSSDNTLSILKKLKNEGLPLIIFEDNDGEFNQGEKTTDLLKWTFDNQSPDIVIPLDADEFVYSTNNKTHPRDYLMEMNLEQVYSLERINYVPRESDDQNELFIPKRITHFRKGEKWIPSKITVSKYIYKKHSPTIQNGNHNLHVNDSKLRKKTYKELAIAHYAIRSLEQLKSKMIIKWLNKTARVSKRIRAAKNRNYYYNLVDMKYKDFIGIAENFRVRDKENNSFVIINEPINLSFCDSIKLKYTEHESTNWIKNLIENMEQMALDYARLKQELSKLDAKTK